MLGPAFQTSKGTHFQLCELDIDFEECYKSLSEKLDLENLEGDDYPYDLTKPLPFVMSRNRKKYLLITSSTTISSIEDMVPNIWVPVKVAYDKHALWGISHRKTFYGYARGLQSTHDVYSTKCILAITQVENRLTNLSGDDVSDFAIALRMFTRSLVIQKQVKDLQLRVESY
ncbi:hypothetical protein Tco_1244832 [Tanacetum coccineum]